MRDQIMLQLVSVRLLVCRTPTTLAHRDITLFHKPAERHGIIRRKHRRRTQAFALLQNDLLQHLLGLPLRSVGFGADADVALLPYLLSVLVIPVNEVLSVPHFHPLTAEVNAALLILHSHRSLHFWYCPWPWRTVLLNHSVIGRSMAFLSPAGRPMPLRQTIETARVVRV